MAEGIAHIISPVSAAWSAWTMLLLLVCAVLSEWSQPGVIRQATASLLSHNDRTYKESPDTFLGQLFVTLFRIGTIAMALCFCVCADGQFRFGSFAAVCGLVLAVLLVKMICNSVLDYVFMLSRRFGSMYEHYSNIVTLAVMVLYPLLLVQLRLGSPVYGKWILAIAAALFGLMWLYRSARQYLRSPMALVYLVAYMLTLECLPMAALYVLSDKLTSVL